MLADENWPDWWPAPYREQYPLWHVWSGIGGLLYARRMMSSPPRVVRGESVEDLHRKIEAQAGGAGGSILRLA
jgi:hypothetical protein